MGFGELTPTEYETIMEPSCVTRGLESEGKSLTKPAAVPSPARSSEWPLKARSP